MGNWRTVSIKGSMNHDEALTAIRDLSSDWIWETPAACFHMHFSLCGLNTWIHNDGTIDCVGNLAERDFTLEDVEAGLVYLAAHYPSLDLTLHSGGDYEDLACVATFKVNGGAVLRLTPQIATLPPITR